MYSQDSIDLLANSGLQFQKHEEEGIDTLHFAELLMTSGVVLCDNVKWLSFHRSVHGNCGLSLQHSFALLTVGCTGEELNSCWFESSWLFGSSSEVVLVFLCSVWEHVNTHMGFASLDLQCCSGCAVLSSRWMEAAVGSVIFSLVWLVLWNVLKYRYSLNTFWKVFIFKGYVCVWYV